MSSTFLDEQLTKPVRVRGSGSRIRGAHAPRRPASARISDRRRLTSVPSVDPIPLAAGPRVAHGLVVRSRIDVGAVHGGASLTRPAVSRSAVSRPARSRPGRLRLTSRGRLVFGALLILVALVVFSLGRFSVGADAAGPPLHVTVSAGDTLWSIAEHAVPNSDPRDEVDRIVLANQLADGGSLTPGTVLVVPRG